MVNEKKIKNWYNQRHSTKAENAWRPYEAYPIFLDYLDVKSGRKLLDVGCGTGYFLKAADQKGLETYGVDISDEGVKIAKKIPPNSKIIVGKGEYLNFSDKFFDYVTCLGSLEHFLDIEKGIKEVIRVSKNEALFCIMVPNINFLLWKIRRAKGTEQQDINENLLSLKQWKNLFIQEGLEILKIYQDRWLMKRTNIFFKLVWAVLPLNYTYQFIFILRKRGISSNSRTHFVKERILNS